MMKIKDGYIMKEVAGNNVVIATGDERIDFRGIMMFNEVGAAVFNMLDGTNSVDEIVCAISKEYEASLETIEADVNKLIEKMKEHNLIEE